MTAETLSPEPGNVRPLRPLEQLGADLDDPPQVAGPAPKPDPRPDAGGDAGPATADPGPQPDPSPSARPPKPERPRGEIWAGCPVRPLGVNGATYFYLDVHSQMQAVAKLEAQVILKLFGHKIPALCWNFPQFDKDGIRKVGRFDQTRAAMDMYAACSERGLFNPDGAVRGVGAWTDDDGQLIYHLGDAVLIAGEERKPDSHQGRIYPAYPAIPHPLRDRGDDPARAIYDALTSWNFSRPSIDPMIGLGMIGCMILGGALAWRPTFWVTGSRAAGKSTFQLLLRHLMGTAGLIQSTDATKSGITSRIGHSSLPVALDELEPGEDSQGRERAIIDLARVASSGGEWMRGSADQKGASGNVYSTFLFSSILIPGSMTAADRSRLVTLTLDALAPGSTPPNMRAETWRARGARLKALLIDRWPSWAQRLDLWREALAGQGITGRDADNYGTILAMADMAQQADLPTADQLAGWAIKFAAHVKPAVEEIGSDADDVLTHLLSQVFDPFRKGERHSIATWLKAAGHRPRAGQRLFGSTQDDYVADLADPKALADYAKRANHSLATIGLRVIGTPVEPALFIAGAQVQGLKDVFAKSPWAHGAWTQSLRRVKGALPNQGPRYLDGQQTRGTVVPFTSMPGLLAFDDAPEAAPTPVSDLRDTY